MKPRHSFQSAFTLLELMVGMGVLVLMFGFLMTATNSMVRTMGNTTAKVDQFRGAREAFERVTSRLAQATLNTYWDYGGYDASDTKRLRPKRYERTSDLRFVSGFASDFSLPPGGQRLTHAVFFSAPLGNVSNDLNRGLENLLNVSGFYVEFGQDTGFRPKFIGVEVPARWRWRLMEYSMPTEYFSVYQKTSGPATGLPRSQTYAGTDWIQPSAIAVRPVVDNIVALIIVPRLARAEEDALQGGNKDSSPLAPKYKYDSTTTNPNNKINPKNQLPPVVQVTMVAIDEKSAEKLALDASKGDLFNTSARFQDTANLTKDLLVEGGATNSLEGELIKRQVAYRIFTSNVHLRASKWSTEQTDSLKP